MSWRTLLTTALMLLAPAAWAQADPPTISEGFDAHTFKIVGQDGDPRDLMSTYRAGRFAQGEFWATALFEYTSEPLVLVYTYPDGRPDEVYSFLDNLMAVHLNLGGAPLDFLKIEVSMPFFVSSTGLSDEPNGFQIGDLYAAITASILRPQPKFGGGFGLAVVPYFAAPLGDDTKFLGSGGIAFGGRVAATYEIAGFTASLDAGPHLRVPPLETLNVEGLGTINFGGGVGYLVLQNLGVNVEARAGMPFAKNEYGGTGTPVELMANVRGTFSGFHFVVGGGMGVTRGVGAAAWRVFAGGGWGRVNFSYGDWDGDGVADEEDECMKEKEIINSYQDADGCPDDGGRALFTVQLAGFVETDVPIKVKDAGTGEWEVESGLEPVPLELPAGTYQVKAGYPGFVAEDRFVVTGGDMPVVLDLMEVVPGTLSVSLTHAQNGSLDKVGMSIIGEGAPPGSEVLGPMGLAQMELPPGEYLVYLKTNDGALFRKYITIESNRNTHIDALMRNPRVVLTATKIEVNEKIYFELDSATIKPESYDLLEEIATLLIANSQVTKVEIQGHTDDQGSEEYNLKLSQDRADAVMEFMAQVGVKRTRMTTVGYGERFPIASNSSEAGRAVNRRVEFLILEQQ